MATKKFNSVGGFSVGNSSIVNVIDANANVIASSITAQGDVSFVGSDNVNLGSVSNIHITGGEAGQVLTTDGTGNLSWTNSGGVTSHSISNGLTSVDIPTINSNVSVSVAGNANVLVVTPTGANVTGNTNVTTAIARNGRNVPTFVYQANTAPTSPLVGDQWFNTNNGILFEYLNDGTSSQWVDISTIPSPVIALDTPWDFSPPVPGPFTLVNSTGTDIYLTSDPDVGLLFDGGPAEAGNKGAYAVRTLPNPSSDWVAILKINPLLYSANYSSCGLFIKNSTSDKAFLLGTTQSGGVVNLHLSWPSGLDSQDDYSTVGIVNWFKAVKSGNTIMGYTSSNGKNWALVFIQSISLGWLSGNPDQIGFGCNYDRATGPNTIGNVEYWSLTGGGL